MPPIDALKGIAAQLIVLHHLASYGALSRVASEFSPPVFDWLYGYARIVVQVFLVVAGFLAARGFTKHGVPAIEQPVALIWQRYLRLVPPFLIAILIAVACAALARVWVKDDFIPALPNIWQFLAHGLLLNGVFEVPSLSAGIWYVAIDLQLYALLVFLLWIAGQFSANTQVRHLLAMGLVACLGMAALFYFNMDSDYDQWGIYFFGSYALGALAFWATKRKHANTWLLLIGAVTVAALVIEFRLRIGVALLVALLLGVARHTDWLERCPSFSLFAFLGKISYSVFLVHFPVCLLMNVVFIKLTNGSAESAIVIFICAWLLSNLAGWLFYQHVEQRQFKWPGLPKVAIP